MPYRNLRTDFDRQKSIRLQEFITDWSTGTGLNQSYLNLLHITIVTYEMSLKINTFYNRKKTDKTNSFRRLWKSKQIIESSHKCICFCGVSGPSIEKRYDPKLKIALRKYFLSTLTYRNIRTDLE